MFGYSSAGFIHLPTRKSSNHFIITYIQNTKWLVELYFGVWRADLLVDAPQFSTLSIQCHIFESGRLTEKINTAASFKIQGFEMVCRLQIKSYVYSLSFPLSNDALRFHVHFPGSNWNRWEAPQTNLLWISWTLHVGQEREGNAKFALDENKSRFINRASSPKSEI